MGAAAGPPPQAGEKVNVLIGFVDRPDPALVKQAGGKVLREFTLIPVISAEMPVPAAEALAKNPRVRYVEPNGTVYALGQTVPWGIDRVFGDETHPFRTWEVSNGTNVKVAILDTGIDPDHIDLNVKTGYNAFDETSNTVDEHSHGTHVAGSVSALDNPLGVVGVAPAVELYPVKVLDDSGGGTWDSVAAGIQWSVDNNMQVLNMSLGGSGDSQTLRAACDAAYAANRLLVAAAGNSGNRPGIGDNVGYPARYASVIAVAASDSNNKRATFSSTGPDVELIAPGVSIYSTTPGDKYGTKSGTSMASPHVAGVAALVWAANSGLTNVQVRGILQNTAQDLGLSANHQGHGLVRADRAVAAVQPPAPPEPAVNVVLTTDKQDYVSGKDADAVLTAVVSNENGQAITGLDSGAFTTKLGEDEALVDFAETDTPGTYTGTVVISELGTGTYTVEVTVTVTTTAARDASGTGSATFTVKPAPAESGTVSVVDPITYATSGGRLGDKHLHVTIALVDDSGQPVSGASVSIELSRDGSVVISPDGTTGSSGTVTFSYNNAPSGTYTTKVTDVFADGLTWDQETPENSFPK
ncbi:MAG: S8 family serine peptidase [Candidatus Desulforudis sp.]|nr:S8 family serine peptidase [Desulforudis sp.]